MHSDTASVLNLMRCRSMPMFGQREISNISLVTRPTCVVGDRPGGKRKGLLVDPPLSPHLALRYCLLACNVCLVPDRSAFIRAGAGEVWASTPMSRVASSSRRVPSCLPSRRPSWTERTFVDSDDAEVALCSDRSAFIVRREILKSIPRKIKKQITHPGDNAHIDGFQELFVYLNKSPGPKVLRQLVISYFTDSSSLRGHLSQ